MRIKALIHIIAIFLLIGSKSYAAPIISGISTNEINIDSKFNGAKILLFGAKSEVGDIVVVIRGPKKNFVFTEKKKFFGVWYNGERLKFKDAYGFYSLFSTFGADVYDLQRNHTLLSDLELGKENIRFNVTPKFDEQEKSDRFRLQFIKKLEEKNLYSPGVESLSFLDETLFKVMLDFPKNIMRGVYTVEIYLIEDGSLLSFQSIPIYVNQVGVSAKILDFAYQQAFLYGLISVIVALIFGWLVNYIFARFWGK